MRPRSGISTSEIHFIISKMVSAARADATEVPTSKHKTSSTNGKKFVPMSKHKSSSTNGLQGGEVHPNFENKKNFRKKIFQPPLRPEKYAESILWPPCLIFPIRRKCFAVVASQIWEITPNSEKIRTYSSSRSSKVMDLGANWKRICNFLLVINSIFGRISYRFRDIDA